MNKWSLAYEVTNPPAFPDKKMSVVNLLKPDPDKHECLSKEICRRGHPRTPETTYVFPSGKRQCRVCIRAAKASVNQWRRQARARKQCQN